MSELDNTFLHHVTSLLFARMNQETDAVKCGKAYADFFYRFSHSFDKELDNLRDEQSDYRYDSLLSESADQISRPGQHQGSPAQPIQAPPPKTDDSGGRVF